MPPNMVSPGFAYPASRVSASTLDWPVTGTEVNDDWWRENTSIANRSWHLWRNNAYAVALINTLCEYALGADGLTPRSVYATDADRLRVGKVDINATDALQDTRVARMHIDRALMRAFAGKNFDASGQLSKKDMSTTMMVTTAVTGDSFAIRCWKPNRPGNPATATCWRIVDPARVSNENWGYNTDTQFEGIALDADGRPKGVWVQRKSPYAVQNVNYTWDYIPWYSPNGQLNVIHMKAPGRPEAIRGVGWMAPIMDLINQLGNVTSAYVAAKRVQACIGMIVQTGDANASNAVDSATARTTNASRMYPGMIRYELADSKITTLNWNFDGADHSDFQDSMIQPVAAAWGYPMEVVQHRLSKSNLAASRAALMAAYRTGCSHQRMAIDGMETPWCESVLIEEIATRRIPVENIQDAMLLRFNRPPQAFPDPVREATADGIRLTQGMSHSTIFERNGLDFEQEILQKHQDENFAAANGVILYQEGADGTPVAENGDDSDDSDESNADNGPDGSGNDTGTDADGAPASVDGQKVGAA